MNHKPPIDQRIVDEYFKLSSCRRTKDVAWLYGMVATYGLKPKELIGFEWQAENTISIPGKKRNFYPLHSQWVLLFKLKEKRPRKLQDRLESLARSLYQAIAYQEVCLNITDLLLAYRLRKDYACSIKRKQQACFVFAGVS
jgi:hypothetical protein